MPFALTSVLCLVGVFAGVVGFCKLSFFAMKNHRSAVERDTLVQAFVDVQPFNENEKINNRNAVVVFKDRNSNAPAIIFNKENLEKEVVVAKNDNVVRPPVFIQKDKQEKTPIASKEKNLDELEATVVATAPVIKENVNIEVAKVENIESTENSLNNSKNINVASLLKDGRELLDKINESVLASESQLSDENDTPIAVAVSDPIAFAALADNTNANIQVAANETAVSLDEADKKAELAKEDKPLVQEIAKAEVNPKSNLKTEEKVEVAGRFSEYIKDSKRPNIKPKNRYWVDVAALRESLKAEEAAQKNKQFLETAEVSQASLKEERISDTTVNETKVAVVQDMPVDGTEERFDFAKNEAVKVQENKEIAINDKVETQNSSLKFTAEQLASLKKLPSPVGDLSEPENKTESLWRVAKVAGKPNNSKAVVNNIPKEIKTVSDPGSIQEPRQKETDQILHEVADNTSVVKKNTVIYKNNRPKEGSATVEEIASVAEDNKSLDWMDRQQAAVWTSLSQNDTPSVWKQSRDDDPNAAKAFRIANDETEAKKEEPKKEEVKAEDTKKENSNELTSMQPKVIELEKKPEAISSPTLLPLGPSNAPNVVTGVANVDNVASGTGFAAPKVAAFPGTSSEVSQNTDAKDPTLMNKIFSIFNKNENPSDSTTKEPNKNSQATVAPNDTSKGLLPFGGISKMNTNTEPTEQHSSAMPSEIRLTFKPGSSELSAQSVKLIKKFGEQIKGDIQKAIEVRMSNEDVDLQEKRFALIRSTLIGIGIEDVQVVPLLTDRTPHKIVLKVFKIPEEGVAEMQMTSQGVREKYRYNQW
ncbi:MAG: hypothetical protein MJ247_04845 [Alphaproteobacteria bacterium]|nr:hypothetical protein [Alphaproteobacteria bacterium]